MLFSEPKIPQPGGTQWKRSRSGGFSALQRAENSSTDVITFQTYAPSVVSVLFIEPKIPQHRLGDFLNLSLVQVSVLFSEPKIPQLLPTTSKRKFRCRFSALQRAENSSTQRCLRSPPTREDVSVLFSEPKIPQRAGCTRQRARCGVSVLFSEPKIPQPRRRSLCPAVG